ncbi:DUF308 domain-containing protein [Candidatus Saccharibacteria bacterium]|nr:DUF308 domain-containing protein [Candidatus Saccharibacteria bacterium]
MAKTANAMTVDKSYFVWRGVFSVLVGVLVLVWPGMTLLTFTLLLSIWFLLAGAVNIVDGVMSIKKGGMGWLVSLLVGVLELGVGAYLVQRPALTALSVVTLVALVFVVQGVAYFLRSFLAGNLDSGQRMLSLVFAVLSLVAGVWLWRYPFQGTLAFVWLVGLYAIVAGAIQIASASELAEGK